MYTGMRNIYVKIVYYFRMIILVIVAVVRDEVSFAFIYWLVIDENITYINSI